MGKKKRKEPPPDLPPEGADGTPAKEVSGDDGEGSSALQPYAPQKQQTAQPRGKQQPNASPSAPPLSKASRMGPSPERSTREILRIALGGARDFSEDACADWDTDEEDNSDEEQIAREIDYSRTSFTANIDTIIDQKQTIDNLQKQLSSVQQQLTVSEKRAEIAHKALIASQEANKTMAANFAKDKQNTQKQFSGMQKRLEQLEKQGLKGNASSSQVTTSKASPKASQMDIDQEKLPGPPPFPLPPAEGPPAPQSKVQNSSEAVHSRPQQSNAEAPWAQALQIIAKSLEKSFEKRIGQLQAAVLKGSPGPTSSYAAAVRQGLGKKGKGAAPCPPPTQSKPPSPDPVSSPFAQQTFVLAGVQSLQRATDNVNLETLRKGAETWLTGIAGEPIHVRSSRFLGFRRGSTAPRKILLIVDSPEEAQLIRLRRCSLKGKSECILDGLTSSELAYQRRLRGAFKDAQKKGLSPQFQRARLFISVVMEDGTVKKKEITEP